MLPQINPLTQSMANLNVGNPMPGGNGVNAQGNVNINPNIGSVATQSLVPSTTVCMRKRSQHTAGNTPSGFNLKDAVSYAKNSLHGIVSPVNSRDLRNMKSGATPKAIFDPMGGYAIHNKDYLLKKEFAYRDSKIRFRLLNNDIFSHIDDLSYSTYSDCNKSLTLKERAETLMKQIEFAAKYRPMSFRLTLLAYKNKNAIVNKDKTLCQGAYHGMDGPNGNFLTRSANDHDNNKIDHKNTDEAHISCIPNPSDNAIFQNNLNYLFNKLINSQNIKKTIEEEFPHSNEVDNLICAVKLYRLEENNKATYNLNKGTKELFSAFSGIQGSKRLDNFFESLKKYKNNDPMLDNLKNGLQLEYQSIEDGKNLANSMRDNLNNLRMGLKNSSLTDAEKKELNIKIKELGLQLKEQDNKNRDLLQEFNKKIIELIYSDFSTLEKFLREAYPNYVNEIKIITDWVNSSESPEEKLKNVIKHNYSDHSIIPTNSILGIMHNATLAMPSEINGGVDKATDKSHYQVAELLTEFSHEIDPDEAKINEYMNRYVALLKDIYSGYANNYSGNSLETIIDQMDPNNNMTLHDFIIENESAIARHFEKYCDYDENFEEKVMGEIIEDPNVITTPSTEFQFCNECWIKV